jgi:hypothetical protein
MYLKVEPGSERKVRIPVQAKQLLFLFWPVFFAVTQKIILGITVSYIKDDQEKTHGYHSCSG